MNPNNYLQEYKIQSIRPELNKQKEELNTEVLFDIGWFNSEILKYRKKRWGISRIVSYLIPKLPVFDEIHILCNVLKVLSEKNLAVSRKEVLTCFNKYYHQEDHGGKQSYTTWIYSEFLVRKGGKIR